MTVLRPLALLFFTAGLVAMSLVACDPAPSGPVVPGTACRMFPSDSHWHSDVSALPVHPSSNAFVASIGASGRLKADFGSGLWNGGPIGIPWVVVPGSQPLVPINFAYQDESDAGPYPIPPDAPIEGGPNSTGDRHILIVAKDSCQLYEVFDARRQSDGSWQAGSGARWNLGSNQLRPAGWTSADAAGLPILPGLVRWDEVEAARTSATPIRHAIRITVPRSQRSYLWPARHQAGSTTEPGVPPMGLRLRLKSSVDEAVFPAAVRPIIRALKTYGAIVADNGSPWFISGVPDERWNNDELSTLRSVVGSDFEAVDASSLMVSANSGQARP